ncbi:MAG TPA: glycosyltransferase [Candidatus Binatia bacterium]|nr:glycosyltransferase [Candidatus Binatia bacterium]
MSAVEPAPPGVSVLICAHNAAPRIARALEHLARQDAPGVPWEVVLVDNASTDGTADAALGAWPATATAPLRVVSEPELGLAAARRRGLAEARYEYASFVDDDNWVARDWVANVHRLMQALPEVAVLGGRVDAVTEAPPPEWFERFQDNYAVGTQATAAGDVTWSRGYVWGAGMNLRRSALARLVAAGFRPALTGRKGRALTAGEDGEICLALRLAGWKIWYDPALRMQHFMPRGRLTWDYLKSMWRGFGRANVVLDFYGYAPHPPNDWRSRLEQKWFWRAALEFKYAWWDHSPVRRGFRSVPGCRSEALFAYHRTRLGEMLRLRSAYDDGIRLLRAAPWARMYRGG